MPVPWNWLLPSPYQFDRLITSALNFTKQIATWEAGQKIHGNLRFNIVFTKDPNWTLYKATWLQATSSRHTIWTSTLILSSRQRLDLPSGVFRSDSPPNRFCMHSINASTIQITFCDPHDNCHETLGNEERNDVISLQEPCWLTGLLRNAKRYRRVMTVGLWRHRVPPMGGIEVAKNYRWA